MMQIDHQLSIRDEELEERFIRASGPGGQHVNKTSTAVQLRWDTSRSTSIPPEVLERLRGVAGNRINRDGVLVITARRHRSREQNRNEARLRLAVLIRRATIAPVARKKTRPSAATRRRRLQDKKRRAATKQLRRRVRSDADG